MSGCEITRYKWKYCYIKKGRVRTLSGLCPAGNLCSTGGVVAHISWLAFAWIQPLDYSSCHPGNGRTFKAKSTPSWDWQPNGFFCVPDSQISATITLPAALVVGGNRCWLYLWVPTWREKSGLPMWTEHIAELDQSHRESQGCGQPHTRRARSGGGLAEATAAVKL